MLKKKKVGRFVPFLDSDPLPYITVCTTEVAGDCSGIIAWQNESNIEVSFPGSYALKKGRPSLSLCFQQLHE